MILLLCFVLVVLTVIGMSVVGWQMILGCMTGSWMPGSESFGLVLPSILVWSFLVFAVRRETPVGAAAWGLLSPVIGGMLMGGPIGLAMVVIHWYISFPVGAATGLLVRCCMRLGEPVDLRAVQSAEEDKP